MRKGFPRQPWQGVGESARSFTGAFWAIFMTVLIIGGLMSGLATPTETAVVASVYALVVGCFVYRELPLKAVPKIIIDSAVSSAAILALVGFANVFGWILVAERIPHRGGAFAVKLVCRFPHNLGSGGGRLAGQRIE